MSNFHQCNFGMRVTVFCWKKIQIYISRSQKYVLEIKYIQRNKVIIYYSTI